MWQLLCKTKTSVWTESTLSDNNDDDDDGGDCKDCSDFLLSLCSLRKETAIWSLAKVYLMNEWMNNKTIERCKKKNLKTK